MSTVPAPQDPSLEELSNEARRLQRSVRAGDEQALELVARHHPDGVPAEPERFPLHAAQLVTARRHRFASWPALRRHAGVVERYYWNPDPPADERGEDVPAAFCRLGCLSYLSDGPARWAAARALRGAHPELSGNDIWAAAAANDLAAVTELLGADPALARTRGGPHAWCPLFYLAYSRVDPDAPPAAALGIARRLLDAGADPNEGYLWRGLPTPFTLLTGVFAHGEMGPDNQPPHPHALALGRLLLDAGADPNDGQALYNRMFEPADDHLELLLEYGLGRGDGGPWKERLGDELEAPAEMLRGQLGWAIAHDQLARVRLLTEHGVDIRTPDEDGHTPVEVAALSGNADVVEYLLARGAPAPAFAPLDALIAAVMAGDRTSALACADGVIARLRRRPWLIVWAAARGRPAAVALMLELGIDANAFGRADGPCRDQWQTALHTAAGDGNLELVTLLLAAGADPNLRDRRFNGTPLGWARHFNREEAIDLLTPVTTDGEGGDDER